MRLLKTSCNESSMGFMHRFCGNSTRQKERGEEQQGEQVEQSHAQCPSGTRAVTAGPGTACLWFPRGCSAQRGSKCPAFSAHRRSTCTEPPTEVPVGQSVRKTTTTKEGRVGRRRCVRVWAVIWPMNLDGLEGTRRRASAGGQEGQRTVPDVPQ